MVVVGLLMLRDLRTCNGGGKDIDIASTPLQASTNHKQRLRAKQGAVHFEQLRSDDDVHKTGLILKQQKDDAVGGSRSLASHDQTGHCDLRSVGNIEQLG